LKLFAIDEPNKSKQGDKQQKQQSTLSTLSVTDLKVLVVKNKTKKDWFLNLSVDSWMERIW